MIAKAPSTKIIYLVGYSNGREGILGHKNIQSPQEVKGKTAGREDALFSKILLRVFLQQAGLTEKDILIKDLSAAEAAKAFAAKKVVDVAVTYELYLTDALQKGDGKLLFSTEGTNLIADVIVTRDTFIQSHQTDLQAYFRGVDKAVKLLNQNDAEAFKIVGANLGCPHRKCNLS